MKNLLSKLKGCVVKDREPSFDEKYKSLAKFVSRRIDYRQAGRNPDNYMTWEELTYQKK